MIPNQRHLFDIPDGITYLNSAARSPLLRASVAAGEASGERMSSFSVPIGPRPGADGTKHRISGPSNHPGT